MVLKVTCISASNVENARQNSASTYTCELVCAILKDAHPGDEVKVEIIPLIDYEPVPCRMCGNCFVNGECSHDPAFNQVYSNLREADAIFLVCPHYAPIPSKLVMILEKMEEMVFLNYCANPDYHFPLHNKPVGIIAHGGQTEAALPYYRTALLKPLAQALGAAQMRVIELDAENPLGVVFGIKSISAQTDSIFVKIEHDWDTIRNRIVPLVENVIQAVETR
jgi:multimeric flavodoxin WrbA